MFAERRNLLRQWMIDNSMKMDVYFLLNDGGIASKIKP